MPVEQVQTLIIGGGQAGLVMSHRLTQRGLPHLVVERHRIAERWRSERWDGLRFQFPNWSVNLPAFSFPHTDPDGFAATGEIVDFIEAYAAFVAPPIRCGVAVTRLRCRDDARGFVAETSDGVIEAKNVVAATGPYQRPLMPDLLQLLLDPPNLAHERLDLLEQEVAPQLLRRRRQVQPTEPIQSLPRPEGGLSRGHDAGAP